MRMRIPTFPRWLLVLVVVFSALTLLAIYSEVRRRTPLWHKYQQIHVGMPEREVVAFLGPPTSELEVTDHALCYWTEGNQSIEINFVAKLEANGVSVVDRKTFLPPHWWEQIADAFRRPD